MRFSRNAPADTPTASPARTWAALVNTDQTPPVSRCSNLCQLLSCILSRPPAPLRVPVLFFTSPPDVRLSQDSLPLDSRCCYCYTCTTHRPSLLPLHSASPAAQVRPSQPHLILSHLHPLTLYSFYCLPVLFIGFYSHCPKKKTHNPPLVSFTHFWWIDIVVVCYAVVCRKVWMSYLLPDECFKYYVWLRRPLVTLW